jgi:hypothetical protein
VHVRSYVRSTDPQVRQNDARWLPSLSLRRAELLDYDVVVLGDVPAAMVSSRFVSHVRELVLRFGGGLVILCGPRFGPAQLAETPLAEWLPVQVEPGSRRADTAPYQPRLTARANDYAFARAWAKAHEMDMGLEFDWYHPLAALSQGAEVLAVHPRLRMTRTAEPLPLFCAATAGRGRVAWLGVAETWRLRRASPALHVQFWSELVAWAAEEHVRWLSGRLSLRADRAEYTVGQTALLFIDAYDAEFRPLGAAAAGQWKLELLPPAGAPMPPVRLAYQRPGSFTARVPLALAGDYVARVHDAATGSQVSISLRALAASPERRGTPRRQDLQDELAMATRGRSYTRETVGRLIDDLPRAGRRHREVREWALAHQWPVYLVLVVLLLCDWKWRG